LGHACVPVKGGEGIGTQFGSKNCLKRGNIKKGGDISITNQGVWDRQSGESNRPTATDWEGCPVFGKGTNLPVRTGGGEKNPQS